MKLYDNLYIIKTIKLNLAYAFLSNKSQLTAYTKLGNTRNFGSRIIAFEIVILCNKGFENACVGVPTDVI